MPTIGWFEILIIVAVAIVVLGPKDFPIMLKKVGSWIGTTKRYINNIQNDVANISIEDDEQLEKKENKTKDFLKKENLFTKNYFGREDLELSKGIVSEFYLHKEVSSQIAKDMDYKTDTIEKEIFKRINEILKKEIREQEKSLNYNLPTQKENRLEIVKSLMHSEENGGFLLGLGKSIELPDSKFIEDNIEDITISFVEESFQSHNSGISFSIIIKLKEEILFSIDKNNIKYKTGRLTGAPSIDLGPTNDKCLYFNEYLYIKKPSKLLKQKEEEEQNFNNKEKSKNNKSDFNM